MKKDSLGGVVTFAGGKFYIAAIKNRVHVGFAVNGLNNEEVELFEGNGKTRRYVQIHVLENIDEKQLVNLIKFVDKKYTCKPC